MWWRRLWHRLGVKRDLWLLVQDYTAEENRAIDIFNLWNFGEISRHEAIELFTPDMLKDRGARLWHDQIWKQNTLVKRSK
jgi:hypothetical protein